MQTLKHIVRIVTVAVVGVLLITCKVNPQGSGAIDPAVVGTCPDFSTINAIAKANLQREFSIDSASAARVRAGLSTSLETQKLAKEVDGDLKSACIAISREFGVASKYTSGEAACKTALKTVATAKRKLGKNAKVTIEYVPPRCMANMAAMRDCVAACETGFEGGVNDIECKGGEISGTCKGGCTGECDMETAAVCSGRCEGTCSGQMSGACDGKCTGKCDGKRMKENVCAGTCDGKCDGNVKAACKGDCQGTCKLETGGECSGKCTGKCDGEFKAPACSGELTVPKVSAECKARCDAHIATKLRCEPARVDVKIEGADDPEVAVTYKTALENSFPVLLKLTTSLRERLRNVSAQSRTTLEALRASLNGMTKSGKGGIDARARLTGCLAAPLKEGLDAAAKIRSNVKISIDVQASATASASSKMGAQTPAPALNNAAN